MKPRLPASWIGCARRVSPLRTTRRHRPMPRPPIPSAATGACTLRTPMATSSKYLLDATPPAGQLGQGTVDASSHEPPRPLADRLDQSFELVGLVPAVQVHPRFFA